MSHSPTSHHKSLTKSSWALLVMIPVFVFTFGPVLGTGYENAQEAFSNPIMAIVAALTIALSFWHFKLGIVSVFVDYVPGPAGKTWITLVNLICYGAIAVSLVSIATLLF